MLRQRTISQSVEAEHNDLSINNHRSNVNCVKSVLKQIARAAELGGTLSTTRLRVFVRAPDVKAPGCSANQCSSGQGEGKRVKARSPHIMDDKGRSSRASSTSSLGREVRCACQFFQSDSLLPERRAMMLASRPSSRNEMKPTSTCEHEYEPVGTGISKAPVVRIADTVAPVADSDDSLNIRGRFTPALVLDDVNVILPLDGRIEDSAMEGRELGSGDTSEDVETAQQLQDRLEEQFLSQVDPCTEGSVRSEVNVTKVDSSTTEEIPLHTGARGLPQRIRFQAGKLRSRLNFALDRHKSSSSPKTRSSDKSKSKASEKSSEASRTLERSSRTSDKRSRIQKIRASLPDRPKFNFPQKSKFHLPERPKINLPKMPSRGSFHLPSLPGRRKTPSLGEQRRQYSSESTAGSRKNLFDFATVPRLFDRKSKVKHEYTTSSPKDSRAQSESATLPRTGKKEEKIFAHRFTDIKFVDDDEHPIEKEPPWRRPSLEKPRLSLRGQESLEESDNLPWEESEDPRKIRQVEELAYDEELEDVEREIEARFTKVHRMDSEDSYEPPQIDPRLYGDQAVVLEEREKVSYRISFEPVDPHGGKKSPEEEMEEEEEEEDLENLEDEEHLTSELEEDLSARSDREQQASSGSSCDRRRQGIIDETNSDEYFDRAKAMSQDDVDMSKYLTSEIREAMRAPSARADEIVMPAPAIPPQRPARTRSMRKRKESIESFEEFPPARPKRLLRRSEESDYGSNIQENDDSLSESRHRVVYHAESAPLDLDQVEPLDDIVVVKPIRRKSRSSLRSASFAPSELMEDAFSGPPPIVPRRRKRQHVAVNGTHPANDYRSQYEEAREAREALPRPKSEPPIKPARAPSRETISMVSRVAENYIEPAPIPPKRHSRSRATSIIQDDDRTSRGAESIPDIGYVDDDDGLDKDSRQDSPGYAIIEKPSSKASSSPPMPPRRERNKFRTIPRASPPKRPVRAYSTLRPRSTSPSENGFKPYHERESTPYVEMDSDERQINYDEETHRDLRSGEIIIKMAGRPLPAPPRPPRFRRDRLTEEYLGTSEDKDDEFQDFALPAEAFASTQTDPLPDDLVIEEEITQAKLVLDRSGSQIMVSTERIPSPQYFKHDVQSISHERISSPTDFFTTARSEPDIRASRASPERQPAVPPLPVAQSYVETPPQRPPKAKSKSPPKLPSIDELKDRLTAFLNSETLRIGSLEVGDLKVDKLSVSTLDAHKISASEIDAVIVSATEISNASQEEPSVHPSLLQELIAIRSQLELVSQAHEEKSQHSPEPSSTLKESDSAISQAHVDHLQLDSLPTTTEARSIFSTQGSPSTERHPIAPLERTSPEVKPEDARESSVSPVRARMRQTASPVRSLPPVISVTPDTPDESVKKLDSVENRAQRATISFSSDVEPSERPSTPQSRPSSGRSRSVSPPCQTTPQLVGYSASQIPPQFFALVPQRPPDEEPGILDMTQQLIRALRLAGKRAMNYFVGYVVSRVSGEETEAKIREIELAICALLLIIVGLIIVCFVGPKTITHHHHWDYFNPPRL